MAEATAENDKFHRSSIGEKLHFHLDVTLNAGYYDFYLFSPQIHSDISI